MKRFTNILVGVDLSAGDRLVNDELTDSTVEAINRAIWLAKLSSARLHFFFSLDIGANTQRSIEENDSVGATVLDAAERALGKLVKQAKQAGVTADQMVVFGKSWFEMTRYVLRKKCDLVIVGANQHNALERFFIGSTGMNLLHNCPCPVWVTHPPQAESHGAILVGHDLTAVGDQALELGASLAELQQSHLRVVHVIEPSVINVAEPLSALAIAGETTRLAAHDYITKQLEKLELTGKVEIDIAEGLPSVIIQEQIKAHNIDLLVMGTLARGGIQGLLIGNTAERLLPKVPCSVLAVKPANFQTPVSL